MAYFSAGYIALMIGVKLPTVPDRTVCCLVQLMSSVAHEQMADSMIGRARRRQWSVIETQSLVVISAADKLTHDRENSDDKFATNGTTCMATASGLTMHLMVLM